ncbi:unnamed protein product [Clonostachys rosea]|uniref:Uncharacterized protein n=1 Tax=Bionectria ochroleuca TaxID=29856 RepID=A0ABY6U1D0_BIOOC|nr:unnamed protein product [Clonostachys rosea]
MYDANATAGPQPLPYTARYYWLVLASSSHTMLSANIVVADGRYGQGFRVGGCGVWRPGSGLSHVMAKTKKIKA